MSYYVTLEHAASMAMRAPDKTRAEKFRQTFIRASISLRNRLIAGVQIQTAERLATDQKFAELHAENQRLRNERETLNIAERVTTVCQAELAIVKDAAAFSTQFGPFDDRDKIFFKDRAREVAAAAVVPPVSSGQLLLTDRERTPTELPLTLYLDTHGYATPTRDQLMSLGRRVAEIYRAERGQEPPKRIQWVDGAARRINHYTDDDSDLIQRAIDASDPPLRRRAPAAKRPRMQ